MYIAQSNLTHNSTNAAIVERFTSEPIYDRRNIWRTSMVRMYLRGQIRPNSSPTQTEIKTALDSLAAAYANNNFDIALYHDDGTRSHFYMTSSDSLGGTKVVVRDYPDLVNPCDYANGVGYRIVVEAEYPVNELSPMVFVETLDFTGNCGPVYTWQTPRSGPPFRELESEQSQQVVRQSGHALGLTGYPLIPDPIWPALELQHLRRITPKGPEAAGANLRYRDFGMSWEYTFISGEPLSGLPTFR